jgi:hypothetical protein
MPPRPERSPLRRQPGEIYPREIGGAGQAEPVHSLARESPAAKPDIDATSSNDRV